MRNGIVHHKSDRKLCVIPTADRNTACKISPLPVFVILQGLGKILRPGLAESTICLIEYKLSILHVCGISNACRSMWKLHICSIISLVDCKPTVIHYCIHNLSRTWLILFTFCFSFKTQQSAALDLDECISAAWSSDIPNSLLHITLLVRILVNSRNTPIESERLPIVSGVVAGPTGCYWLIK